MTEEEKRLYESIQKTVGQGAIDGQIQTASVQKAPSEILAQYDSQKSVTDMINEASEVRVESLLQELNQYGQQNITPYTRKNNIEYSENFQRLYMYCSNLPQYIENAITDVGEILVPNVGIPDSEILHIIENWMNRYLEKNHSEEQLQTKFIVPEYQRYEGDTYRTIYKTTDILKINIQKIEKTK